MSGFVYTGYQGPDIQIGGGGSHVKRKDDLYGVQLHL